MKFIELITIIESQPRKIEEKLLKSALDETDFGAQIEPNIANEMVEELHEVFDANLASRLIVLQFLCFSF